MIVKKNRSIGEDGIKPHDPYPVNTPILDIVSVVSKSLTFIVTIDINLTSHSCFQLGKKIHNIDSEQREECSDFTMMWILYFVNLHDFG